MRETQTLSVIYREQTLVFGCNLQSFKSIGHAKCSTRREPDRVSLYETPS